MKRAAAAIAIGRVLIGAGLLAAPRQAARGWLGAESDRVATQGVVRGLGARDLALGAGLLAHLDDSPASARWLAAGALGDLADAAGALAAGDAIPRNGRLATVALAGSAAVAGTALAVALARD